MLWRSKSCRYLACTGFSHSRLSNLTNDLLFLIWRRAKCLFSRLLCKQMLPKAYRINSFLMANGRKIVHTPMPNNLCKCEMLCGQWAFSIKNKCLYSMALSSQATTAFKCIKNWAPWQQSQAEKLTETPNSMRDVQKIDSICPLLKQLKRTYYVHVQCQRRKWCDVLMRQWKVLRRKLRWMAVHTTLTKTTGFLLTE